MVQKRVELAAVLFLAVILLSMPTTLYRAISVPIPENPLGAIAGFETIQLVPDPNLALTPNVIIEGSSGEFSVGHHITTGGTDFNYLRLNRRGQSLSLVTSWKRAPLFGHNNPCGGN